MDKLSALQKSQTNERRVLKQLLINLMIKYGGNK